MRKTFDLKVHRERKKSTLLWKSCSKYVHLHQKRVLTDKSSDKLIKITKGDMMKQKIWTLMKIQIHMTKIKIWIKKG